MTRNRFEAFRGRLLAIMIAVLAPNLKVPNGVEAATLKSPAQPPSPAERCSYSRLRVIK